MSAQKTIDRFLKTLESLRYGELSLELPDGSNHQFTAEQAGPKAHLQIHEPEVITNLLRRGDIAFAEDYRDGKWDSNDPSTLIEFSLCNRSALEEMIVGSKIRAWFVQFLYILNRNSRRGSRRNIHAHYDLGNQFYQLWLDESMTYSAGLYHSDKDSLSQAQCNKYQRILEHIGKQGQNVLEIGCGWGGFIEQAIQQADHHVSGLTISEAQRDFTAQRFAEQQQAKVLLQDYRDIQGRYDAIVSIEMFEAIGEQYWKTYFEKIRATLAPHGAAVIQTITIADELFLKYRNSGDAIRSMVFPGGMLPSLQRLCQESERAGLQLCDTFCFGQDYAKTLRCWLERFQAQSQAVSALGFDQKFQRLWQFYLAYCCGAFAAGQTDVLQLEFRHA